MKLSVVDALLANLAKRIDEAGVKGMRTPHGNIAFVAKAIKNNKKKADAAKAWLAANPGRHRSTAGKQKQRGIFKWNAAIEKLKITLRVLMRDVGVLPAGQTDKGGEAREKAKAERDAQARVKDVLAGLEKLEKESDVKALLKKERLKAAGKLKNVEQRIEGLSGLNFKTAIPVGLKDGPDKVPAMAAAVAAVIPDKPTTAPFRPFVNTPPLKPLDKERASIEHDIASGDIGNLTEVSSGVNPSFSAKIKSSEDPNKTRGVFVKPDGPGDVRAGEYLKDDFKGPVSQAEREVIAYELDRDVLGLDVVSPTLWRNDMHKMDGMPKMVKQYAEASPKAVDAGGCVSFEVPGKEYSKVKWGLAKLPDSNNKKLQKIAALDWIVGHLDRHGSNWKVDAEGEPHIFDHGLAFPSGTNKRDSNLRSGPGRITSQAVVDEDVKKTVLAIDEAKVIEVMGRYEWKSKEADGVVRRLRRLKESFTKHGRFPRWEGTD